MAHDILEVSTPVTKEHEMACAVGWLYPSPTQGNTSGFQERRDPVSHWKGGTCTWGYAGQSVGGGQ